MSRVDEAFAIVPVWVTAASDRAVKLYVVLSAMRDYGTDIAEIGRKELAAKIGCSVDSLDRSKAELERMGAISVERSKTDSGAIAKNLYTIHRVRSRTGAASEAADSRTAAATDSRTGAATKNESKNRESSSPRTGRAPTSISSKKVTAGEEQFALSVLTVFNEVSGKSFGSKEALKKIILRHREHPELTVDDHRRIIERQFKRPWWKGDPSVSVVYGNGDVFDRALNGVGRDKQPELDPVADYRD